MLRLTVYPAEREPFDFTASGESLEIGRSTRCDIVIADRFLSRRHARIYRETGSWFVEDLGSRNGTLVNGRKIDCPSDISPGDVIALSASTIRVHHGPSTDAPRDLSGETSSSDQVLRSAAELLRRSVTPPPEVDSPDSGSVGRYASRLALLNQVHQAMASSVALDDLLELILDLLFAQLNPDRAEIFMRCDDGGYTCVAQRSIPTATIQSLYSENLFSEVVGKSLAALVTDAGSDERVAPAESPASAGVCSILAAPLSIQKSSLGLIVLGSGSSARQFSEEDLELLVTLASIAALRIHNLALAREAAERHRLERELTLARSIQIALIPERLPEIDGYLLYGETIPSRGVSGDYYQVVTRSMGDELVITLADVSGKGISAAILTGYLEAVASTYIEGGLDPGEVLRRVSPKLHARTPANHFATMFLGVLDPAANTLRYASAGHAPACLVRAAGDVEWLSATGLPLGLLADADFVVRSTTLDVDDTLVIYSDGYTEAERRDGEEWGQDALAKTCLAHSGLAPEALAAAVDRALEEYAEGTPFHDDRTIVVARRVR